MGVYYKHTEVCLGLGVGGAGELRVLKMWVVDRADMLTAYAMMIT